MTAERELFQIDEIDFSNITPMLVQSKTEKEVDMILSSEFWVHLLTLIESSSAKLPFLYSNGIERVMDYVHTLQNLMVRPGTFMCIMAILHTNTTVNSTHYLGIILRENLYSFQNNSATATLQKNVVKLVVSLLGTNSSPTMHKRIGVK